MKSYMNYILSKFAIIIVLLELIFVSRKNTPETVLQARKIQVLREKWAKSQTKAQKSLKDDFIREIW